MQKVSKNKYLLIGLGLAALLGLIFISYNGTQNNKTSLPYPSQQLPNLQPKSATMSPPKKDEPVSGQIIIKFKPQYSDVEINAHLAQYHASIIKKIDSINQTVVKVPAGQENSILEKLKTDSYTDTIQRDYTTHAFFTPNDQGFGLQYALNNTGQSIQGKSGKAVSDIRAETAWDTTRGTGIKVAIIDTGVNLNHPDLAGKIIAQKTFISGSVEDGNGHGTHVAGIIAADANNSIGISGACPGCLLIIGKSLNDAGEGTTSDAIAGITWAADQGAKVINVSFGTNEIQSAALYNLAVSYAMQKGAVVVAAAGNDGKNEITYPAAATGVISVAGTDNNDQRASWSNYGTWIKLAAPGNDILSTGPTHKFQLMPFGYNSASPYMYLSGTSMAGPYVSAVAAMVSSTQYGTTPQAVIDRLYETADKISGTGTYWVYGRVNAAAAVGSAPTAVPLQIADITPTIYCVGGAGVSPCATIPPIEAATTVPSGSEIAPSISSVPSSNPTSSEFNPSVSPGNDTPSSNSAPITGNNDICLNISQFFNNFSSTQTQINAKIHIKCGPGQGGRGGAGNKGDGNQNGTTGGDLSKFFQLLLQFLQQLLQLIGIHCNITSPTPGTGTPTPIPSGEPDSSPSVSPTSVSTPPSSGSNAPTAAKTATPPKPTPTATTTSKNPSGQAMPVGNLSGWKQIFSDDFNTTIPVGAFSDCNHNTDSSQAYCNGLKPYGNYFTNWWAYPNTWNDTAKSGADGNTGAPFGGVYHPEDTVSVNNGAMHIRMFRPSGGGDNHVATVVPKPCMGHKFGRYVERFKVVKADTGFKSAHLFYDGGFEIDYPENDYGTNISAYTHPGEANFDTNAKWTGWHTTAIEWTSGSVKFYMDGKLIGTTTNKVPNVPMSWTLQNESSIMGPYAKAGAVAQLDIDWVTCYAQG